MKGEEKLWFTGLALLRVRKSVHKYHRDTVSDFGRSLIDLLLYPVSVSVILPLPIILCWPLPEGMPSWLDEN